MNQRNLLNLGMALALAGLIAVLAYEPDKETPTEKTLLTQLTPENIHKLNIETTRYGQIILSKTANQWQMSKPFNNQANTLRINKLLALAKARSHTQYSTTNINLEELKLSDPDLTINLDGTKLIFGTTDAIKGYRYIQIGNTVHLITDRYSHLIRGQATNLLSPALLPKNMIITRLVLPILTMQKSATGWKTTPDNNFSSADQLQQLLDEWRFARALRVSKTAMNNGSNTTDNKIMAIEVYGAENGPIIFNLSRTKDE
ncbi:MAG: DUF4340 domain-containing protein, partial [Gammaproteobacteria bacterium]|nr:DUF4340 domain-containing protein [Gammaproteobacteria bacterium]